MDYNTEKDKIEYLNKLSLHMKQAIKGVDLILAYEGYKEGLELEDCLEYIENNMIQDLENGIINTEIFDLSLDYFLESTYEKFNIQESTRSSDITDTEPEIPKDEFI